MMNSGLASTARLRSKPGPRDAVEQGSNRLGWPARVGVGVWYREIPPLRNQKFADLYGSFSVKWFFVCCRFLVWSGKAVPRPVACDQVRGARGRCQGSEMLAQLSGLP